MAKTKALVRVKVFRTFEYVKSMLHRDLFMQDALNKARNDMQVFVDEVVNNDHARITHDMFQYEATEELGYKLRSKQALQDESQNERMIPMFKVVKALTTRRMESKHGPLNPELSPQLFDHDPEVRSDDGQQVLREEQWFMKEKIENEYYTIHEEYAHLLRNLK